MKRRSRTNLYVALLLSAMLVLAWLTQRQASSERPQLAALEWSEVQRLEVERAGRAPLAFERRPDGSWWMTAPAARNVEAERLEGIVRGLNTVSHVDYRAAAAPLAELGLGRPPNARVTVDGAEFRFGDANPVTGLRYVQHGDTVHLVDDLVYFRLGGDPGDW